MAQKKITDLQLIAAMTDSVNIPGDNGIQTYRVTGALIKAWLLAASSITRTMLTPAERLPVATVLDLATSTVPTGYLECDGSAVSRSTYADLFASIGVTHGQGDNSTTFNLPDYRGRFKRGWSHGQTRDPDKATRTAMATGGATGDNVGSIQTAAYASHIHAQASHTHNVGNGLFNPLHGPDGSALGGAVRGIYGSSITSGIPVSAMATTPPDMTASGGNETRPINASVMCVIKY